MNDTVRIFGAGKGNTRFYYSLPALEEKGFGKISRLPVSIRIVLESVLRNCDGKKVTEKDVATLAAWMISRHVRMSLCASHARTVPSSIKRSSCASIRPSKLTTTGTEASC